MANVLSVNVGMPRQVGWKGRIVTTAIFKAPVTEPVMLRRHNLEGDRQADLSVHGGPSKAVYLYPSEHYKYWQCKLVHDDLQWGSFGENLTTDGIDETQVCVGDEFRIGDALIRATEPRMPCFKLGLRFGRPDMVRMFVKSKRTGFYCSVVEDGKLQAGAELERVACTLDGLTISEVFLAYTTERTNKALLRKAVACDVLPASWRDHFKFQLARLGDH